MPVNNIQDFLGIGLAVPFTADAYTGDVSTVRDEENVRACVRMFMHTQQGELVFEKAFGLPHILFENYDPGTSDVIKNTVMTGLARYEPRIRVLDVISRRRQSNTKDSHGVQIILRYVIRATGRVMSETYDYDAQQGL